MKVRSFLCLLSLLAVSSSVVALAQYEQFSIENTGQKAVGHNDLFFPHPSHPIPYKKVFEWDDEKHYHEKHINNEDNELYRRSSCPAINSLANRGYINRSGRNISYEEISQATRVVWNFGDDNIFVVLAPTKGNHPGLDRIDLDMLADEKVQYETNCPAAPTRNDREVGDNVNMNLTLFEQFISASADGVVISLEEAAEHHHRRHNDSKANNPNFRFGNQGAICSLAQYGNMFGVLGRIGKNGMNTLYVEDVKKFYLDDDWPVGYARREMPFYSPEANSYIDRMSRHIGYQIQRPYPPNDKEKIDVEPETALFQIHQGWRFPERTEDGEL